MIKGLMALFTTGIIFNPMVLLGVVTGFFAIARLDEEQIKELFFDYHLYLLVLLISAVYSFVFKKVYKDGGVTPDYVVMTFSALLGVVKFAFAAGMAMAFVMMLSFLLNRNIKIAADCIRLGNAAAVVKQDFHSLLLQINAVFNKAHLHLLDSQSILADCAEFRHSFSPEFQDNSYYST